MIRAILFDLDETLLDRSTSLRAFLADQHARFGAALGHAPFPIWRDRFLTLDARGYIHKSVVYPQILADFGGDADAAELLADYQEHCCRHARPFAGMVAVLATLRGRGHKTGIITNGETDFQARHIGALALEPLMDVILISQKEGLRKPDSALFKRAADRLALEPRDCLFVGDNPQADILGAHDAGMQTAWFAGTQEWPAELRPNPGHTITQLSDLLAL